MERKRIEEREKWHTLDRSQRLTYIWDYYKVHIGVCAIVLVGLAAFIWHLCFTNQEAVLNFAIVNEDMDTARDNQLARDLAGYLEINPKKEKVVVDSNYNIAYHYDDETNQAYYIDGTVASDFSTYEKYFLNLGSGTVDAAVIPEEFLEYCESVETYYSPVEQVLTEEQMQKYEDIVCCGTDASGNSYAAGLYTDGTIFDASYFAAESGDEIIAACGRQVLVFPKKSQHPEHRAALTSYVFENLINSHFSKKTIAL